MCRSSTLLIRMRSATIRDRLNLIRGRLFLSSSYGIHLSKQLIHTLQTDAFRLREDKDNRDLGDGQHTSILTISE